MALYEKNTYFFQKLGFIMAATFRGASIYVIFMLNNVYIIIL